MKNFKKIVLSILLGVLVIVPSTVYALTEVKTNEELKEAVKNDSEIVLQNDIIMTDDITVRGQKINIDLNGNSLTLKAYIRVYEGSLEFSGKGLIKDDREDLRGTIYVYGSTDSKAVSFATLTVGKDVKIETKRYGIVVWPITENKKPVPTYFPTYGTVINFNGTIISTNENAGGITISGNLKNDGKLENAPIINIGKTAVVKTTAEAALYAAGIGVWNIDGGVFEGKSAIGIKSGKLVINDGTFTATGETKTGELYGNGIISTGSSIQIENNKGYAGNIEITINGGTFKSEKGLSIYHYPPTTDEENALKSLVINGGVFKAKYELLENDNVTIEYGEFASEIIDLLKNGYVQLFTDGVYTPSNIIGGSAGLLINGKTTIDYIKPGEEVTISTKGMFELESLDITTSDDKKVTVKDNKFIMPNKLVRVNAKTIELYEILYEPNENVKVTFTVDGVEKDIAKEGSKVKFSYTVKEGYVVKSISLVNTYTDEEVEVKDNTFTMPEGSVELKIVTTEKGDIKEVTKPIEVSKDVDKEIVEDLSKVKLDNTKTGLLESVDTSKLEGVTETDKVEVSIKATLNSYDKEKNTLVFDIKPFYSINGTEKGIIPNNLLTKTIKIELPVPSNVTDTHVKVIHKSGEKVIDTKNYEIKTREDSKYITIETESFSTFELSFYTPSTVENPTTGDGSIGYILLTIISLLGLASGYGLLKHSMNK
jgi:hypothetical protein